MLFISHYLAKSKPDLEASSDTIYEMMAPSTELRSRSYSRQLTPNDSLSPDKLLRSYKNREQTEDYGPLSRKDSANLIRKRVSLMRRASNSPVKSDSVTLVEKATLHKKAKRKLDGILIQCKQLSEDIRETQFENRRSHSKLCKNIKQLSHMTYKGETDM